MSTGRVITVLFSPEELRAYNTKLGELDLLVLNRLRVADIPVIGERRFEGVRTGYAHVTTGRVTWYESFEDARRAGVY